MVGTRFGLPAILVAYTVFLAVLSFSYSSYASDEAFYMNTARDIIDGKGYTGETIAPIMSLFIAGLGMLTGNIELAGRMVSPIAVVVTSFVIYLFSKEIFGKTSLVPTIIFMTLPMVPILGVRVLPDMLFNMFLVVTLYLFYVAVKRDPSRFVLAGIALSLTFFTRYAGVMIIPIVLGYLIIDRKSLSVFRSKWPWIGIAAAAVTFLAISLPIFGTSTSYLTSNVSAYTDTTIDEPFYFYAAFFPLVPFAMLPIFVVGIYNSIKFRKEYLWALGSMAFLVLYKLLLLPIREFRYLIDSSLFVVIISSAGLVYLGARYKFAKSVYFKIALVVLVSINMAAGAYLVADFSDTPRYDEIRHASEWASVNCDNNIATNAGRHVELYTGDATLPLTSDNLAKVADGSCIIYSPYEPAVHLDLSDIENRELVREFGQVKVYRK